MFRRTLISTEWNSRKQAAAPGRSAAFFDASLKNMKLRQICPLPCCVLQTGVRVRVCLRVSFVDLVVPLGTIYILASEHRLKSSTLNLFVGQFFLNRSKNLELFQSFIMRQLHRVRLQTTQNIHRQINQTFLGAQK